LSALAVVKMSLAGRGRADFGGDVAVAGAGEKHHDVVGAGRTEVTVVTRGGVFSASPETLAPSLSK
jgi:hypothetical protein